MGAIEIVAHRAGNDPAGLVDLVGSSDLVELDVHWHRGRIEVRHAKRVWGTRRLWDRWYLLPRDAPRATLDDVLAAAPPDLHLLIDMKGWSPRLATAVRAAVTGRPHTTVATKAWWLLRPFAGEPAVRTLSSAGTRLRLALLRRTALPRSATGVVVHERLLTKNVVVELAARGPVFTWAVSARERAVELGEWGVNGLIVDDLEVASSLRTPDIHRAQDEV